MLEIALGMHFNTQFHLRIKQLKELYTQTIVHSQIGAEPSVYATLNKKRQKEWNSNNSECNCVTFDTFFLMFDKRMNLVTTILKKLHEIGN